MGYIKAKPHKKIRKPKYNPINIMEDFDSYRVEISWFKKLINWFKNIIS